MDRKVAVSLFFHGFRRKPSISQCCYLIIWFTPPVNYAILIDNKYQRQDLIKLQFLTLNLERIFKF